ncbi:MAG: MarR family transcriptional regulator [Bacteroides sp.]|nr:MarR family transcriptional regulator [Syntrophomonadaceae bacterium]MDD4055733.1 MarR family transcriptional regulator [Bacteroides sp.]MDD4549993.1 MarR family transcriptional regulator [Syntrophomonadaceae bacterium]
MDNNIADIYSLLQEIAWYFGDHGLGGECCADLSFVEFMALKKAYENKDSSIQDIGNALNFTKSGSTRIIDRLENKGYIIRERSALDARVCCVPVTIKGTEVMKSVLDERNRELNEILKDLDSEMIEQIKDVLDILVTAIQRHETI